MRTVHILHRFGGIPTPINGTVDGVSPEIQAIPYDTMRG